MKQSERYDVDAITDWLTERIATEMKLAPDSISMNDSFFNIGLNSLNTLIISTELNEFLGVDELSPSLFWDYPTIAKMAHHLSEHLAEQPQAMAAGSGSGTS